MDSEVLVVGGGAAGMVAAWRAASRGRRTVLLEKTPRLGTKILISGGGRCNVTHEGDVEAVLAAFETSEARFLRPSLYRFPSRAVIELMERGGVSLMVRPDGRVFPSVGNARDIVAVFERLLQQEGVVVEKEVPASGLLYRDGRVVGVSTAKGDRLADQTVVAAGGSSYPKTGTTGDGWAWARTVGHTVVPVRAALAPIDLRHDDDWPSLSGVAVRDCVLRARQDGKEVARWRDDLLITHHGVSGPTALGISRMVAEKLVRGPVVLEVDTAPDEPFEALAEACARWCSDHPRRRVAGFVDSRMPERLVPRLMAAAQVPSEQVGASFGRKARNRLVAALKAWPLGEVRTVPLAKGEVVAGGIALDEVDPKSMASRKAQGLWLCGEILDIAGPVGGYNLQAAFSTGYVAGESAAAAAAM